VAEAPEGFRSGLVAVVGRPNVGKSTLVNALVGGKVAITSDKPQTTRGAVRGIVDRPAYQVVLIDTPGYHKPRTLLGERLNRIVRAAWSDVDVALLVLDGAAGIGRGDERVASELAETRTPVLCVVNKVDVMSRERIAGALAAAGALSDRIAAARGAGFEEFVPVSARAAAGVSLLEELLVERLPEGPALYPPGTRTDQPPPVFVAEIVREKLLARMQEEVPHSIAVVTEDYEERAGGLLAIHARIYVERDSQKGIVIGKGGATLKAVGSEARAEIEVLFGRRVYLELRVRVEPDWQRRAHALDRLGLGRDL
jgi:GTPase